MLYLIPRSTNFSTLKIDNLALKTYETITNRLSIEDKLKQIYFFEETFLLTNTNIKIVLKMLFFCFSNINIYYNAKKVTKKTYTITNTMSIAK